MAGGGTHRVFVDSNVFFSRTQRDWLGLLYLQGDAPPFAVFWIEDVLAEVVYHLRRQNPGWDGQRISSIRDRIAGVFETGRVSEFPTRDADEVRDQDDMHVHAAAVACAADILLTNNVRDFPNAEHYDVMQPDEFFVLVDNAAPHVVRAATREQATYWGRRDGDADLPGNLRKAKCPEFAGRVLSHLRASALEG